MKGVNTFFILGAVGVVVTALLHVFVASLTGRASVAIWTPVYVVWVVFVVIGLAGKTRSATGDSSRERN